MSDGNPKSSDRNSPKRGVGPLTQYARILAAEVRRFRKSFTRENSIAFAKTMAWVVPLTLLIWVYAEREQDVTEDNVTVAIGIQESDPKLVVKLIRPADGNITCSLQGPRSKLDEVIQLLQPHGNTPPLIIDLGSLPVGSSNPIPLLPKIHENSIFRNNGVSAIHCSPDNLIVDVDILQERDIPVESPATVTNVEATFSPSSIKIRAPKKVLDKLVADKRYFVTADIANLPELNKPGLHAAINVSLLPPDPDPNVTLMPGTVQVVLNVQQRDVVYTIPNVTIDVQAPPGLLEQNKVQFEPQLLANVSVSGPPEKIAVVKQVPPVAVVTLTKDDLNQPKSATTNYTMTLPPGVTLAPGTNTEIKYTITRRGE